jgi:hypothetical protein
MWYEGGKGMTTKKSNGGEGKGPSPTKRAKTATTKKMERASSAKPAKRTVVAGRGPSIAEHKVPTSEELQRDIAKRAFELYERRGWNHGEDLTDWLEAEQQVLTQKSLVKS